VRSCGMWTWWRLGGLSLVLAVSALGLAGWTPSHLRDSLVLVGSCLLLVVGSAAIGWQHHRLCKERHGTEAGPSARTTISVLLGLLALALLARLLVFPRLSDPGVMAVSDALRTALWMAGCGSWFYLAAVGVAAATDLVHGCDDRDQQPSGKPRGT